MSTLMVTLPDVPPPVRPVPAIIAVMSPVTHKLPSKQYNPIEKVSTTCVKKYKRPATGDTGKELPCSTTIVFNVEFEPNSTSP